MLSNPKFPTPFAACRAGALLALLVVAFSSPPVARQAVRADGKGADLARTILNQHCKECHGSSKPKGDFHLDRLTQDFNNKTNRQQWLAVLEQVEAGTMPPRSKPRLPAKELRALTNWIGTSIASADAGWRAREGRVVLRRLNRAEYENTVRDLLGVEADLKELLALDSSMDGFDNVGSALHISSFAMERYLEAADTALGLAIANGPQPKVVSKRYSLKDQHPVRSSTERVFRHKGDTVVLFSSSLWNAVWLSQFYPSDRGYYRFRISASAVQSGQAPVTFRVMSGTGGMNGKPHLVDYFDAPAGRPTVIEFIDRMEPRTTISILPHGLARAQTVHKEGADNYKGPGVAIDWVEVEGPLNDAWPPASHRRIFGDLPQQTLRQPNQRDRVEVVSKDPDADARRILGTFARRAFRRAVSEKELQPYLAQVKAKLAARYTFEQAVRVGLLAIMVAPEFLFLHEKPGPLDDFALASRLSYFLWSSMPDDELIALAERGELRQPDTLRKQVERLLASPRALAFTQNFVGQWLALRDIDFTEPSHILYPEFDHMLRVSMVRETELFFKEVLDRNLPLTNFLASDFSMLNGRLAKHYGIPGVEGFAFRKVPLPADSHRGGVLTMASVLKVTADGTSTNPVKRGAWIMDRLLGKPPPPPPADVPSVIPDIRGATTIREQLAKHRTVPACAACHVRIDPPGFALENFDVIGGWRDHYRVTGHGQPVIVDGQRMPYHRGARVDAGDQMPDGQRFRDIDEFKQLLLKDKEQFARALLSKLLTYATGAAPEMADRPEIDAIVRKVGEKKDGFRTLVHEIVQSKSFQTK